MFALVAVMLAAIADGGTVLRLGPNGLDLEPLGLHDAGPMLEQYLSWPALEAALSDAGPLTIEISDDARWSDVEKTSIQLGAAGRSDVPVIANTSMGFSFDVQGRASWIKVDAKTACFFEEAPPRPPNGAIECGPGCSAPWRRRDPPRAVAVELAGQSLMPLDIRAQTTSPLRFNEMVAEVEAIRCASCRLGLRRQRSAAEWRARPSLSLGQLLRSALGQGPIRVTRDGGL